MAKIDLARRAEIGREKRARTRAQLLEVARSLYARHPIESVTIDQLVNEAGMAKGTFYVHFTGLEDLQAALADEMAGELDSLLQPARLALNDPIERIAGGSAAFIGAALRNRAWAALIARSTSAMPELGQTARDHLMQDLKLADERGQLREIAPELAFEFVIAIMQQAIRAAAEDRLKPADLSAVIAAILRAISVPAREARDIARRVAGHGVLIGASDRHPTGE